MTCNVWRLTSVQDLTIILKFGNETSTLYMLLLTTSDHDEDGGGGGDDGGGGGGDEWCVMQLSLQVLE